MIYLLYGSDQYLINNEIKKIIKNNKIEDIDISKYELEDNAKEIIEDASTISMFDEKKLIIVDNANIFTSTNNTDTTLFEEYLENPNPSTIIIFKLFQDKIDERKKITKLFKKNGTITKYETEKDITKVVAKLLGNYKMSTDDIKFLIDRVGNNVYIIEQELEKIKIYKDTDLKITRQDIIDLTSKNIDADLFKLMDAIINNNSEMALRIYDEMTKVNIEPIQLIVSLANKYRLMYQVKEFTLKGYKQDEIASILEQKPGYIYMLLKNGREYTDVSLLRIIKRLADLDYQIKSNSIDKNLAFELFILNK